MQKKTSVLCIKIRTNAMIWYFVLDILFSKSLVVWGFVESINDTSLICQMLSRGIECFFLAEDGMMNMCVNAVTGCH